VLKAKVQVQALQWQTELTHQQMLLETVLEVQLLHLAAETEDQAPQELLALLVS